MFWSIFWPCQSTEPHRLQSIHLKCTYNYVAIEVYSFALWYQSQCLPKHFCDHRGSKAKSRNKKRRDLQQDTQKKILMEGDGYWRIDPATHWTRPQIKSWWCPILILNLLSLFWICRRISLSTFDLQRERSLRKMIIRCVSSALFWTLEDFKWIQSQQKMVPVRQIFIGLAHICFVGFFHVLWGVRQSYNLNTQNPL